MTNHSNFLASEFDPASPDEALFHVFPVPLEKTVSYGGGTARGPAAILSASNQLEAFDGHSYPGMAGIFTAPPINCNGSIEDVLARIEKVAASAFSAQKIPIFLGGEHSLTQAPVRALAAARTTENTKFGVVQVDAHADLRNEYEGTRFGHACVMRRIVEARVPIFQIGVRSLSREEIEFRQSAAIPHFDAARLHTEGLPKKLLPDGFPREIYLTFDVDGFDSSLMPATGIPEPGGLFWHHATAVLEQLLNEGCRIIGFDVVELAPIDSLHACDFTTAKLIYAIIGCAMRSHA